MIEFRTLGAVQLRRAAGSEVRSVLCQPKRLALLAYLAAAAPRSFHRRDTLLGLLWPELDEAHARNALGQALHGLRQALGRGVLVSRGSTDVGLEPSEFWCDVPALEEALEAGDPERALELYRGELLEGFFLSGAPEFERWLDGRRRELRRAAVAASAGLADASQAEGDLLAASGWAARAVHLDPYDEAALRRLIVLLDACGERARAIAAYERFRERLVEDLAAEPSPETRAVVEGVRAREELVEPPRAEGSPPGARSGGGETVRVSGAARVGGAASVEPGSADDVSGGAAEEEAPRPRLRGRPRPSSTEARSAGPIVRSATRAVGLTGAAVVAAWAAAAAAGAWLRSEPRASHELDADLIAVAPFNTVGLADDPVLWREGLVELVSRTLDGAGPLRAVPPSVVLGRSPAPAADRAEAGALARELGAGLIVYGSVVGLGTDSVRLEATLMAAPTRNVIGERHVREEADRIDRAADSVAVGLLRDLGRVRPVAAFPFTTFRAQNVPALKAFLRGERHFRAMRWDSAALHYRQATVLDSTLALAHSRLWYVNFFLGHTDAGYESVLRAGALNRGQSLRDSLLLAADSLSMGLFFRADSPRAVLARRVIATLEEAARRYPGDPEVWWRLGVERNHFSGILDTSPATALEALDRAVGLGSVPAWTCMDAVPVALALGREEDALRYVRCALSHQPRGAWADAARILEAALAGELDRLSGLLESAPVDELDRALRFMRRWADPEESDVLVARTLARRVVDEPPGMHRQRRLLRASRQLMVRGRAREAYRLWGLAGGDLPNLPVFLAEIGFLPPDTARLAFRRTLAEIGAAPGARFLPWLTARGDTAALGWLLRRADSLEASGPDPRRRELGRYLALAGRAYRALARGDTLEALAGFDHLADLPCPSDCSPERLQRARLLAATGSVRRAAELLDGPSGTWPGSSDVTPDLWWTLERARVADRLGHRQKALRAYGRIATLWRHADPELRPFAEEADAAVRRLGEIEPR